LDRFTLRGFGLEVELSTTLPLTLLIPDLGKLCDDAFYITNIERYI